MPWGRDNDDEYPECPECGDSSGEYDCERPFDFPTVYIEDKTKLERCKNCHNNPRFFSDGEDFDLCRSCLFKLPYSEQMRHLLQYKVIA